MTLLWTEANEKNGDAHDYPNCSKASDLSIYTIFHLFCNQKDMGGFVAWYHLQIFLCVGQRNRTLMDLEENMEGVHVPCTQKRAAMGSAELLC